jgi:hypothetical protein
MKYIMLFILMFLPNPLPFIFIFLWITRGLDPAIDILDRFMEEVINGKTT